MASTPARGSPARWQVSAKASPEEGRSPMKKVDLEPHAKLDEVRGDQDARTRDTSQAVPKVPAQETSDDSEPATTAVDRIAELVKWIPGSNEELFNAEDKLLSFVKSPHELVHVSIGPAPDVQGRMADQGSADEKAAKPWISSTWVTGYIPSIDSNSVTGKILDNFAKGVGFRDRHGMDEEGNCYINTLLVGDVAKTFAELHPREVETDVSEGEDTDMATGNDESHGKRNESGAKADGESSTGSTECLHQGDASPSKPEEGGTKKQTMAQWMLSYAGFWGSGEPGKGSRKVNPSDSDSEDSVFHDAHEEVESEGGSKESQQEGEGPSPEEAATGKEKEQEGMERGQKHNEEQDKEQEQEPDADSLESEYSDSDDEREAQREPLAQTPWPSQDVAGSGKPTLVMVHGYAACLGFYFRNYDTLAEHFNVYAIDQLGWGASSRPSFTPKTPEEAETWFVEALELWREEVGLEKFILLGHSFGGYISARYALKYPQYVQRLILVGPAGFNHVSKKMEKFKQTWKGLLLGALWDTNITPQLMMRFLGPWSEDLVRKGVRQRWGNLSGCGQEDLPEDQIEAFGDYTFQSFLAPMSGEFCMKHIFSLGAFARRPLIDSAMSWMAPTTFIYGESDIMDYRAGLGAAKLMPVDVDVLLVQEVGHMLFIEKPTTFNQAVIYACREQLSSENSSAVEAAAKAVAPYIIPLHHDHEIPMLESEALFATQGPGRGTVRLASGWGIG